MGAYDDTIGAILIGVLIGGALWGVSCCQVWFYYNTYPQDHRSLKSLVTSVLVSETVHQILVSHVVYTYMVTNFNNPIALQLIDWSGWIELIFNTLTGFMVQCFYIFRIWTMSNRSYFLTGFIFIIVIGSLVMQLIVAATMRELSTGTVVTINSYLVAMYSLACASDILIAACMIYLLKRRQTGIKRSDNVLNKLMLFVLNTGLLTGVCSILALACVLAWPDAFWYSAFYFILGRLYSNSLYATLNARSYMRNQCTYETSDISMAFYHSRNQAKSAPVHSTVLVDVRQSTDVQTDTETQQSDQQKYPLHNEEQV